MLSMICLGGAVLLVRVLDALGEASSWLFVSNAVLLMVGVFGFWLPSLVLGLEWLGVFASAWVVTTGVITCGSLPGALVWLYVVGLAEG